MNPVRLTILSALAMLMLATVGIGSASTTTTEAPTPSRALFVCGEHCDLNFPDFKGPVVSVTLDKTADSGDWKVVVLEKLTRGRRPMAIGPARLCAVGKAGAIRVIRGVAVENRYGGVLAHHAFEIIPSPSDATEAFDPSSPCWALLAPKPADNGRTNPT